VILDRHFLLSENINVIIKEDMLEEILKREYKMFKFERDSEGRITIKLTIPKILPDTTRSHLGVACREGLLAFRSLFDVAIERIEKSEGSEKSKI
jgi:hypothetical protein